MENNPTETILYSLPLERLEPIFKGWIKDVLQQLPPAANQAANEQVDPDYWMTIKQLIEYLPDLPHITTLYRWIKEATIPVNKTTHRLRFRKSEIDAWLNSGRKKTYTELFNESLTKRTKR